MPSSTHRRSIVTLTAALAVGLGCLVADPAAAQSIPDTPRRPVFGPVLAFVAGLAVNLVLGAIVVGVAPDYSEAIVRRIRSEPVESFVFGIATLIATLVVAVLLAITIIGLVVLVPGAFLLAIVGLVANVLATVTVGAVATGWSEGSSLWTSVAVGAVVVALLTAIPVVSDLTNFVLGTFGMGAIAARIWERRRG